MGALEFICANTSTLIHARICTFCAVTPIHIRIYACMHTSAVTHTHPNMYLHTTLGGADNTLNPLMFEDYTCA